MDTYRFLTAGMDDVDATYALIKKRIDWMDENEIRQWNVISYLESYPRQYFADKVALGQLYVMKDLSAGWIVGAVVLADDDTSWNNDGSAHYYIRNLVTDPKCPGI